MAAEFFTKLLSHDNPGQLITDVSKKMLNRYGVFGKNGLDIDSNSMEADVFTRSFSRQLVEKLLERAKKQLEEHMRRDLPFSSTVKTQRVVPEYPDAQRKLSFLASFSSDALRETLTEAGQPAEELAILEHAAGALVEHTMNLPQVANQVKSHAKPAMEELSPLTVINALSHVFSTLAQQRGEHLNDLQPFAQQLRDLKTQNPTA